MNPDAKRRRTDDDPAMEDKDRISNLPEGLISSILNCMSIRDAARTSVLSKSWKNIWETHPRIILGGYSHLFSISSNLTAEICLYKYIRAVNCILLAHRGPISEFVLVMPPNMQLHACPYYLLWMKQLADKGVRDLRLFNPTKNPISNLPSYFFSCSNLTTLYLVNCRLNPPSRVGGFYNLTKIFLQQVVFTADMSFGSQVRCFRLNDCAGLEHLDGQLTNHSNNINLLIILRSVEMEKRYAPAIDYNQYTNKKKSFNLYRVLGGMPSIKLLVLDSTSLEFLDPGLNLHNQLTTTMENLKRLYLSSIAFNHVYVISNVFCLLRSMPILEHLQIIVGPDKKHASHINLTAEQYLESLDHSADIIMNQLQTVVIRDVMGSRAEILLMKLLIASSPSLRSMTLMRKSTMNDPKEEMRIVRELLQFPRKSAVEIFWT